jgi:hypothetical protein
MFSSGRKVAGRPEFHFTAMFIQDFGLTYIRRFFPRDRDRSNVVDWIGLAQDRNRRRALVNSVMNLRVP